MDTNIINTDEISLDYSHLMHKGATDDIINNLVSPVIKTVIVPECDTVDEKAYLIDLTLANEKENITAQALECISTFCTGGEVAIYVKIDDTVKGLGFGDEVHLFNVLPPMLTQLFDTDYALYTKKGTNPFTLFDKYDASVIRIWLR